MWLEAFRAIGLFGLTVYHSTAPFLTLRTRCSPVRASGILEPPGKRLVIFWEQRGCPYCKRAHEVNFRIPTMVEYIEKNFMVLQLNLWGDREVTDFDGEKLSEKNPYKEWVKNKPLVADTEFSDKPDDIEIDLAGTDIGTSIKISSVTLPSNVVPTITGRDFVIATVAAPTIVKEPEKPAEEAAAEGADGEAAAGTDGAVAGDAASAGKEGEAAKKDDKGKDQSGDKKQAGSDKKSPSEKKPQEKK